MSSERMCLECAVKYLVSKDMLPWQRAILVAAFYMADKSNVPCSMCGKPESMADVDPEDPDPES